MNYYQTISSIVMVLGNVTKKLPRWVCRNASSDITSRDVAREWLMKPPGRVQFILSFGFPSSPSHCALRCVFLFASSIRGGGTSRCYALSPPEERDCVLEPCCGDVSCPGRFSYLFLVPSTGWKCGSGVEGGPGWDSRSFLDSPFVSHSALQTHCDVVPPPSIKRVFMF